MLIALSLMQDQLYRTAWQKVWSLADIRKIVSRIFKKSIWSFYTSFVVNEAVLGQIFLLALHFIPSANCSRHRRWYISWYVTSAPFLPGLVLKSFKSSNHFPTGKSQVRFPDGVIGFFHWRNPSGRTKALGSTQPLTEMSTRSISWG
jgi:hypothetical protein